MTPDQIKQFCPAAERFANGLLVAFDEWGIDTHDRQAAFLAQVAHESGGFHFVREIWGPTPAQTRYEGRKDLGNTQPGDGKRFLGRGLIQVTGRQNYHQCSVALFTDDRLLATPEILELPEHATASAAWYWHSRNLNRFADSQDFSGLTKAINGGLNGLEYRLKWWEKIKEVIQ